MKTRTVRLLAFALAATLALCSLSGCGGKAIDGVAANDILTFKSNAENRPIIRIGTQYYTPDTSLVDALQEHFPEYLFVLDYAASAGVNSEDRIAADLKEGVYYDMLITGKLSNLSSLSGESIIDLSAESFLDSYHLSSLNDSSIGGHIFSVPGASTLSGIAFNADMFNEHGWEIPKNTDEFFELCEEIKSAGIAPFSTNFKYVSQLNRLFGMMCYPELFGTKEGAVWIEKVQKNEVGYSEHMRPFFELAKRFADAGLINSDIFSASLTKQRQSFWAGEFAMIEYSSAIFTYAQAENAPFELGIMPYPAKNAQDSGFSVTPDYYICIPKCVEKNPDRLELIREILTFISTAEGQQALLADSLCMSNVKNVDLSGNPAAKYVSEAYSRGNLYPPVEYTAGPSFVPFLTLQQTAVLAMCEGASVDEALEMMENGVNEAFAAGEQTPVYEKEYEVIAFAEKSFTMLETSYYIADKLRSASGADVALMINRGFFRSNLAHIDRGDITSNMNRFVMKGVGAEDYLTTYKLTGAQLRQALEYPIVNGEEPDVFIAASGLSVEYAPWNERGSRILELTLEDGTALEDDKLYTVAAWAGVLDERYITETVTVHDDLGAIEVIMEKALRQDKTIEPDIANRVKLVWGA